MKSYLPRVRFLTVHYTYFIGISLVTSAVFWGSSSPANSVRYIDSLFLTTSAMNLAGLNTVNLSTLNTFQQLLLLFLIISGSAVRDSSAYRQPPPLNWQWSIALMGRKANLIQIWASIAVVVTRKRVFEKRFKEIVQQESLRRQRLRNSISLGRQITWPRSLSRQPTVPKEPDPQVDRRSRSSYRLPASSSIYLWPMRSRTKSQGKFSRTDSSRDKQSDQQADHTLPAARNDAGLVAPDVAVLDERSLAEPNGTADADAHLTFTADVWDGSEENPSNPVRQRMRPTNVNAQSLAATQDRLEEGLHGEASDVGDEGHLHFLHKYSRNSSFHNLSERERQKLGGAEYRALSLLSIIVPVYFLLWQLLGGLGAGAYIARNKAALSRSNGLNPWYVSFSDSILEILPDYCSNLGGRVSSSLYLPSTTRG